MSETAATLRTFVIAVLATFSLAVGLAAIGSAARADAAPVVVTLPAL